ncbi:MAG: endonuclease/exonuclease/phosphatase family protein [Spirochaetaceae bacterium]|nr:endonuclease/exonuclease/phosphatase family protein [Spirochaetaceae bacterium]
MKTLIVATWNVQALFDGEENGAEYAEYRMAAGWSEEKYQARLTSLGESIARMAEWVPDVLALQEVENGSILKGLAEGRLAKYGYTWTFFATNPGAPLGVGLLSRVPLLETTVHSVTCNGNTSPRPIAEVRLAAGKKPITLFICHWKSKVNGEDATEAVRRASARVVLRRLQEIKVQEPDLPVIILGDLNENHDEFYRRGGTVLSALLPDDPLALEFSRDTMQACKTETPADFLVISGQKPPQPQYFVPETITLYSPWGNELEKGSYSYQGNWETIDHFLLSKSFFDGLNWEFDACEAPHQEPFINDRGIPRAYNPRTGSGLSDHLPLLLKLKHLSGSS